MTRFFGCVSVLCCPSGPKIVHGKTIMALRRLISSGAVYMCGQKLELAAAGVLLGGLVSNVLLPLGIEPEAIFQRPSTPRQ